MLLLRCVEVLQRFDKAFATIISSWFTGSSVAFKSCFNRFLASLVCTALPFSCLYTVLYWLQYTAFTLPEPCFLVIVILALLEQA